MSGTSSSTQDTQQSQQSTTAPWQPAQGALTGILGQINGMLPQTAPNAAATGAFNTIAQNAQNMPNYGPQATNYVNQLIGGGPDLTSGVNTAFNNYQTQMQPYLQSNYLDPTQSPGMQSVLQQIQADVGNSVNSQFAGAGRDMSGLNQQTLARGIAQGEAAPLLNQYNQNVAAQQGAASGLWNAANTQAGTISGLNQTSLANQAQGYDLAANGLPGLQNQQANAILAASQAPLNYQAQNLGLLEGLTIPIAGLGSQSQGTGTSSTQGTQTQSPWSMAMQGIGAFGSLMKSDRRTKQDIEKVGALYDGTPIYRFRYIGDPRVTIGLMADEVETFAPQAVIELGGIKHVDYRAATNRAAAMGEK